MNSGYIYIVGNADKQSTTVSAIRKRGYKVGLLLDQTLTLRDESLYDRVERVDYAHLDNELPRLADLDLSISGLQCTYENYVVAKAKLGEYFHVPAPSVHSAMLSTNKALMREAFITANPDISPHFEQIETTEQAVAFANAHGYPVIIKPTSLVKSLLVLKCDNEVQLRERFSYALETISRLYEKYNIYERSAQLIIEEFIVGSQYSIAAFVDASGTPYFCQGIVSLKNAQDIHVDDNYLYSRTLPADLPEDVQKHMFEVAETGIRALDMRSIPAHVELMHGSNGTKIIEIGARIGGYRPRMYGYSYGIDLTEQEINLAVGNQPELEGEFSTYSAVYELFPEAEGEFVRIDGDISEEALTYYRITVKPGEPVGPAKNGFKATAILIVTEKDEERFKKLCRQVDTLKVITTS